MADENTGKSDVNIDEAARNAAAQNDNQTRDGGASSDAGNGKSEGGDDSGTGTGEGGASGGEGEGEGDTNPATGKPWTTEEWRDKFRASAKGAQDLLTKVSTAEGERDTYKGEVAKLSKDLADLKQIAEGKNPEGLKAHEVQAKLAETSEKLALITEESSLDKFERATPLATGKVRESLKALARANPTASLQKLYDENLKAGAEAADTKRKADIDARNKGASDKGKGTSTREPQGGGNTVSGPKGDTGLSLEEFNALPVAKRKTLIEKYGIA